MSKENNKESIINEFHKLYYQTECSNTWKNTFWMGVPIQKCPLDLWIYQEIIYRVRPDIIIESGTYMGGSALFLVNILDLINNNGSVISIDIKKYARVTHHKLTYITGSSTDKEVLQKIKNFISLKDRVLVILDSDHSYKHVINEMNLYKDFVSKDSYMIIEDSNINGNPVVENFGPGPMEAINEFISKNTNFQIDSSREKFMMTFNPKGYLKRIS